MKKQFFRVKQLADQTFLRAEKSKQLNNELQEADHKVEYLRVALAAISKRLPTNGNQGLEKDVLDKRMKKTAEYQLGLIMKEYGLKKEDGESDDGLFRPVLTKCGKAQTELARELAEHEIKVEQLVSTPIQNVLEADIPAILKSKRTLSKFVLDKDSANNRYQTASKHGTKNEALRDEMEEAEMKVEQCRDSLAAEMFSLLRRESDFAQYMLQLVKLQRAYHESALYTLEQLIPDLEKEIGDSPVKAVYGCPLEEHLRLSKRQIALPLELCVCALWELGMTEEGLFRVAGGTSKVRRMKLSLDSGCFSTPLQLEYRDVHVIASALKSYLRELPEPLLTYHLYDEWMRAAKYPTEEQRFEAINNVLSKLPEANYDNLRYLIKFLAELSKNPSNKMTSSNIAIVIAPNLLWSVYEVHNGIDMSSATVVNSIVEVLVSHVDRFFPGELNVYQTFKRDDLFSDLTEFERPTIAHLRTGSNDTALIQLEPDLERAERYSPPHGSPKPFMRRKNKPAPNPPAVTKNEVEKEKPSKVVLAEVEKVSKLPTCDNKSSVKVVVQEVEKVSKLPTFEGKPTHDNKPIYESKDVEKPPKPPNYESSTLNRVTCKHVKTNDGCVTNGKNKMSVSVGTDGSNVRRKSLDFDPFMCISKGNSPAPLRKPEVPINKSDISFPITTETTVDIDSLRSAEVLFTSLPTANVQTIQSTNIHQITAQNATVGKIKVANDSFQQSACPKPVAAPRTSLLDSPKPNQMSKSLNEIELDDGEMVQLRRTTREEFLNRPAKPVVPERPATLRPSFRSSRTEINPDLTQLERTHVYSVPDKQQVSIVQMPHKAGHDTQMAEKEKFLLNHPDNVPKAPIPITQMEKEKFLDNVQKNPTPIVNSTLEKEKFLLNHPDNIQKTPDVNSNLVRTQSFGSRPGRPPKPDVMKSLERINMASLETSNGNTQPTSHSRTMSDGNIIDSVSNSDAPLSPLSPTHPPASPRAYARPPRPQPPPPPPPVRPKSDGESTDL